ncbi:MAG: hypothetical protein HKN85_00300 [Gammaproteobacteria bacterium]|nr:hypothetical protein [Gammaproteobacteria bacterium]
MKTRHNRLFKTLVSVFFMTLASAWGGAALALDNSTVQSARGEQHQFDSWVERSPRYGHGEELRSVLQPLRWVKGENRKFRSKSDVMRQVKARYNATVLKISLNEKREVYNVRLLMQSGKIRNIQVSARR